MKHGDRIYRDSSDKVIGGVCSGFAKKLDISADLLRIITVVVFLLSSGTIGIAYIVLLIVLDEKDLSKISTNKNDNIQSNEAPKKVFKKTEARAESNNIGNDFTIDSSDYDIDSSDFDM